MRRSAFYGPACALAGEESVDQSRGEGIAAADAVVDFEVFANRGLVERSAGVADGSQSLRVAVVALRRVVATTENGNSLTTDSIIRLN